LRGLVRDRTPNCATLRSLPSGTGHSVPYRALTSRISDPPPTRVPLTGFHSQPPNRIAGIKRGVAEPGSAGSATGLGDVRNLPKHPCPGPGEHRVRMVRSGRCRVLRVGSAMVVAVSVLCDTDSMTTIAARTRKARHPSLRNAHRAPSRSVPRSPPHAARRRPRAFGALPDTRAPSHHGTAADSRQSRARHTGDS
jgi:hypothetical protein